MRGNLTTALAIAAVAPKTGTRKAVRAAKDFNKPLTGTLQDRPSAE